MKISSLACILLAAFTAPLIASTTFQLEIAQIRDSSGAVVPAGTIGILVADANNDGSFSGNTAGTYASIVGTTLSLGSSIGSDKIVGIFHASDYDSLGHIGFADTFDVTNTGGVTTNTKLALYWFPGVTTIGSQLTGSQNQMGFFRSDTPDLTYLNDVSNSGFAMPGSDSGGVLALAYGDSTVGGGTPQSSLQAFNIAAAPEPSRVLLLGLGALGLVTRRRRK